MVPRCFRSKRGNAVGGLLPGKYRPIEEGLLSGKGEIRDVYAGGPGSEHTSRVPRGVGCLL